MYLGTVLIFCVFIGVQSHEYWGNELCHKYDSSCITKLADDFLRMSVKGDSSRGIDNLDPMHTKYVEGTFAIVKYELHNSTVDGFRDCHVVNSELALEKNSMNFTMYCPFISMYGLYQVSGILIIVPVEGKGDYRLDAKDYHIKIETTTKIKEDKEGKRYLQFKNFKATGEIKGGLAIDLKNLFNGQNDILGRDMRDTLAPSHLPSTAICVGTAAAAAENLKRRKYSSLVGNYMFEPFGVETLGSWGPSAQMLFKEIAKRLFQASGVPKTGLFLAERISVAIQRGKAANHLGTFPIDADA